jgi:hypothetical protein
MGDSRDAYRVLVGRPEGRRPLGRLMHRWEDNIKKDFQEVEWGAGMDWIDLAQDREKWWALLTEIMNLWFPQHVGNFLAEDLLDSQEGLHSMELVIIT